MIIGYGNATRAEETTMTYSNKDPLRYLLLQRKIKGINNTFSTYMPFTLFRIKKQGAQWKIITELMEVMVVGTVTFT